MAYARRLPSLPTAPGRALDFPWRGAVATLALTAAALLLGASSARAVGVYAGPDIVLAAPGSTALGGNVTNLSPIDYWTGDGNNALENHLLHYNSQTGLSAVGPLQTSTGTVYGYPTDLQKIGSAVYGLDQYWGQIYTVDLTTGIVTPVGPTNQANNLSSLAYDASSNILYTESYASDEIYALDPATGAQIGSPIATGLDIVYGMAFNPANSLLYLADNKFKGIYTIDPSNPSASAQYVTSQNYFTGGIPGGNRVYSELQFYDGKLYGMFTYTDNATGTEHGQLRQIDLATGQTVDIGPLLDDVSLHSLLIQSMPEDVEWTVVGGPGTVTFVDPTDPNTTATFSAPGIYELRLAAIGNGATTADTMFVRVPEPGPALLLLSGLLGILALRRWRGAAAA